MKKALSLLLALAMCLSLAACGGKNDSKTPSGGAGSTGGGASTGTPAPSTPDPAPEASTPDPAPASTPDGVYYTDCPIFNDVDIYGGVDADTFSDTMWTFAGGFTDGHELSDEEAATVLELYGGTLALLFDEDAETAGLVQGGGTMLGLYEVLDDTATLNLAFELEGTIYEYVAVLTAAGEEEDPVLVLVSLADPSTAFYMAAVYAD